MGADPEDAEAAFRRRAALVVVPSAVALGVVLMVLVAKRSQLVVAAVVARVGLALGWNLVLSRHRRRAEPSPIARSGARSVVLTRAARGPWERVRLVAARGVAALARTTPVQASSERSVLMVMDVLAAEAGDTWSWQPVPAGTEVSWTVSASGAVVGAGRPSPKVGHRCAGLLNSTEAGCTFDGRIRPADPTLRISLLHLVVFGLGGVVAVAVAVGGLLVRHGEPGGFGFLLIWGMFGVVWSVSWVRAHATAIDAHERILRAAFGDDVEVGPVAGAAMAADHPAVRAVDLEPGDTPATSGTSPARCPVCGSPSLVARPVDRGPFVDVHASPADRWCAACGAGVPSGA